MYHYKSCGLENIYLSNGYSVKDTPYGSAVSIEDIDGLHFAISRDILLQRAPLTGRQFRFLRKEQDLTQAEMASILGVTEQTVAAWEKQKDTPVQNMADICMRAYCLNNRQNMGIRQTFPVREEQPEPVSFEHDESGWIPQAA